MLLQLKILTFLSFFLAIGFAVKAQGQKKPNVLATASMLSDIASNIAGDKMDVSSIVPIGGDPHTYKPTTNDAKLVVSADLILMNGLTFEGWLTELIKNSGTKAPTVLVTEGVKSIKSLTYDSPDPHAWMDATNGTIYADNIAKAIIDLDPANKDFYQNNLVEYKKKLEDLDKYIFAEISKIPENKRILITSHDAFQYYGRRYGLRLESILGTSTDADVQTDDVIHLQKVITESNVPAVFIESTVNPKLLQQIASDNGIRIGGKLLSDSVGDEQTGGTTYLTMLKQNTDVIVAGLTRETDPGEITENKDGNVNWVFTGVVLMLFLLGFTFMYKKMS